MHIDEWITERQSGETAITEEELNSDCHCGTDPLREIEDDKWDQLGENPLFTEDTGHLRRTGKFCLIGSSFLCEELATDPVWGHLLRLLLNTGQHPPLKTCN